MTHEPLIEDAPLHTQANGTGFQVRVEPLGETLTVRPSETLMRAAVREGLRWPTICKGGGLCGACFVRILNAEVPAERPAKREEATLKLVPPHMRGPDVRLACQLVPRGTMTVERAGVVRREA